MEYCANVVDEDLKEKQRVIHGQSDDPTSRRKTQAAIFANEVKVCSLVAGMIDSCSLVSDQRNQIHNELTVEDIIRKRSVDGGSLNDNIGVYLIHY